MKKMIWLLLLGLCLNASWAQESQQEDTLMDQTSLQSTTEHLEGHPSKFADLAKATMDLMGPLSETAQINEQNTKHLQN